MNGNGAQEQMNTLISLNELLQSASPVSTSAVGHIYPQPEKETAGSFLEDVFRFATSLGVDTGEFDWRKLPLYFVGAGLTVGSGGAGGLKKKAFQKAIPTASQRTKQAKDALSWLGKWVENPKTRERMSKLVKSYDRKRDWQDELLAPLGMGRTKMERSAESTNNAYLYSKGFPPTTRERAVEMTTSPKITGFKEMEEGVLGQYMPGTDDIFLSDEWLKLPGKYKYSQAPVAATLPSTVVHEGTHRLFYGRLPMAIHDKILSSMDLVESNATRNLFAQLQLEGRSEMINYLKDPDELYSTLMALRKEIGVNPGEKISKAAFHGRGGIRHKLENTAGRTRVSLYGTKKLLRENLKDAEYAWLSHFYKPETLRKLLNTLPALTAISLVGEQNK